MNLKGKASRKNLKTRSFMTGPRRCGIQENSLTSSVDLKKIVLWRRFNYELLAGSLLHTP